MRLKIHYTRVPSLLVCSFLLAWASPAFAQMLSSCVTARNSCNNTAGANRSSCYNLCDQQYPPSTMPYENNSCRQSCMNTYNSAYANCTSQHNSCIASNQNYCYNTFCPGYCGSGNTVSSCIYNDASASCQVSCACNPYSRPSYCPGGPNAASCNGGTWVCNSPIVIDPSGDGFALTAASNGVWFDLTACGQLEHWS